ncbi:sensor histidine kinase [Paenibacillus sp. NPDC058071]|uniref:cache domain-containing sensor histidine kinase n=1 Tax=Paenibacillus sp. NPDC058071 TaxID=3346326 RepID=UPI0036DA3EEF
MRSWLEKMTIRFTRSMSLRGKILVMFVLILLLPTLVLSGAAISLVIQSYQKSYFITMDEAVRQTARNVDFGKQSYELLAVRTATDIELIARLGRKYDEMPQIVDTVNYVDRTFLITSKYLPGIADFRIYHTNETLVQDGQLLWRPEGRMLAGKDERTWYSEAAQSPTALRWSNAPDNANQIVITRKIADDTGTALGMVYILLNYDTVFSEMLSEPFKGRGNLYIIDSEKRILAATDRSKIGGSLHDDISANHSRTNNEVSIGSSDQLQIVKPLSSGWNVVGLFSMKYIDTQNGTVLILISAITLFFLLLSTFLMLTIVKNIVYRIRKLGGKMSNLSRGDFDVVVRNQQQDELGELERVFNSMTRQIGKLVDDITKAGKLEKELAFKALQAQINPHFVYNSLSLLRWRALDAGDEEQIAIIDALSTFYRFTLNNNSSFITINDELTHVRAYLDIQQFRYMGRVRIEWNIDESVGELYVLKTMLQPIVENCYIHGAITKKKDGLIRISVCKIDDKVLFTVYDNGQGIPKQVLQEIEAGTYVSKNNGFGTSNIKERLALYFGDRASFKLESREGEWTNVSVVIPVSSEKPAIRGEQDAAQSDDRG